MEILYHFHYSCVAVCNTFLKIVNNFSEDARADDTFTLHAIVVKVVKVFQNNRHSIFVVVYYFGFDIPKFQSFGAFSYFSHKFSLQKILLCGDIFVAKVH